MEINNVGSQTAAIPTSLENQTIDTANNISAETSTELSEAAANASASIFFSLLQNIMAEAQSNSG